MKKLVLILSLLCFSFLGFSQNSEYFIEDEFDENVFSQKKITKVYIHGVSSIPASINSLKKLESIDLYGSKSKHLEELPDELGDLKKLKYLYIAYNNI